MTTHYLLRSEADPVDAEVRVYSDDEMAELFTPAHRTILARGDFIAVDGVLYCDMRWHAIQTLVADMNASDDDES